MEFGKALESEGFLKAYILTGNENFFVGSRDCLRTLENVCFPESIENDPDRKWREKYFRQRDRQQLRDFYQPNAKRIWA